MRYNVFVCLALLIPLFHPLRCWSDQSTANKILDGLVKGYSSALPPLEIKFEYSATAGPDYAQYTFYKKTLFQQLGIFHYNTPPSLVSVEDNKVLAKIKGEFVGDAKGYYFSLTPVAPLFSEDPHFAFKSESFYDGSAYLVRLTPGSYTSLQGDYQPIIASMLRLVDSLPPSIPDHPALIPKDNAVSYTEVFHELIQDPSLKIEKQGTRLLINGVISKRPGDNADEQYANHVTLTVDIATSPPELVGISFQTVVLREGKVILSYAGSNIIFSDYVLLNNITFPKSIVVNCRSSLVNFGGKDAATIATMLKISERDVQTKQYDVITHKYICTSVNVLPSRKLIHISLSNGEVIFDRFSEDYIHPPQSIDVDNISTFLDEAKTFTTGSL